MRLLMALATVMWLSTECGANDLPCNPGCGDRGVCVADHGNLSCRCDLNWFGEACDRFICEESNPCGNGLCFQDSSNPSAYHCSCPIPTYGEHCEYTAVSDACHAGRCMNGAFCHGRTANSSDYFCNCTNGYYGLDCQYECSDPCDDTRDCNGHGICYHEDLGNGQAQAQCDCDDHHFVISFCRFEKQPVCYPNPCINGGNCTNAFTIPHDYKCNCPPEWVGKNCNTSYNVCEGRHCGNGHCKPIGGGHYFICICQEGYSGLECDVAISDKPAITSTSYVSDNISTTLSHDSYTHSSTICECNDTQQSETQYNSVAIILSILLTFLLTLIGYTAILAVIVKWNMNKYNKLKHQPTRCTEISDQQAAQLTSTQIATNKNTAYSALNNSLSIEQENNVDTIKNIYDYPIIERGTGQS